MHERSLHLRLTVIFASFVIIALMIPTMLRAKVRTCPPFHLRNDAGGVINPLTGENANQPYSTRHTCNACHSNVYAQWKGTPSKHGQVACSECHTEHAMIPECSNCHEPPESHAAKLLEMFPNCLTCHLDVHDLPVKGSR